MATHLTDDHYFLLLKILNFIINCLCQVWGGKVLIEENTVHFTTELAAKTFEKILRLVQIDRLNNYLYYVILFNFFLLIVFCKPQVEFWIPQI